ncbi:methyltransferase family protein [Prauserella shujinwangii]|uniref:Methyltransferase family protein n=1 Tax=Prauserella shujinwangii TaxID=1453103 RepID=A0A2T0M408_9PSEU|nr:class I SAM-dependent methyltransferase [Prauserella shujinwangii]PRX51442.1 methyltransferase family protein [Prauserella shujinwangii]
MTDSTTTHAASYSAGCLSKDLPTEQDRLRMQEEVLDPHTVRLLDRLPVRSSWRCLEIGAGAGSVAYRLAERCRSGSVLAVDVDTRFLDEDRAPNLSVAEADITTAEYPAASFDLVHARMVLCHLARRDEVLAAAARWLAPGGWLVVEEPYFFSAETSPYGPVRRLFTGVERKLAQHGADMRWARKLPGLMARLLGTVPVVDTAPGPFGGEPGTVNHELSRVNVLQVGPLLVRDGTLAEAELEEVLEMFTTPGFLDIMSVNLGVCAEKPGD